MLEPEKLRNRTKQGWPDSGKGSYSAQRRQDSQHTRQALMDTNRVAQHLRREAETRQEYLQHHRAAEHHRTEAETPEARQERLLRLAPQCLHSLVMGIFLLGAELPATSAPEYLCYTSDGCN